jgi:hypothetical protein
MAVVAISVQRTTRALVGKPGVAIFCSEVMSQ